MTIKEFVDGYKAINENDDKAQREYIKSHIVKDYIPYSNKMLIAKKIADITTYDDAEKKNKLRVNTPLREVYFILEAFALYTDVDISFKSDDVFYSFDLLAEEGLNEIIEKAIGRDCYVLEELIETYVDDIITNQHDLVGWLNDKLDIIKNELASSVDNIDWNQLQSLITKNAENVEEKKNG